MEKNDRPPEKNLNIIRNSGILFLTGWTIFCYGFFLNYISIKDFNLWAWKEYAFALSPIAFLIILAVIWSKRKTLYPLLEKHLQEHTEEIDRLSVTHTGLWIALAAALSLYAELMVIRLHGSFFQLFAYFKNVSLLSCFLGLGVGYALGNKKKLATPLVFPALTLQIILMHFLRSFSATGEYLQNPISEQLALGLNQIDTISHIITVYSFLILVFIFNALCFIPLGQLPSRLMSHCEKLVSYNWNLGGSLAGIILFYCLSFLWAPPSVWLLLCVFMLIPFLSRNIKSLLTLTISSALALSFINICPDTTKIDLYSPYQLLTLSVSKESEPEIIVNNVYFQRILKDSDKYYSLPYYIKEKPEDVLIVGSGTGNDVASAVKHGAGKIDAVEIDPAILNFGKLLHPESPYDAKNVNPVVNDARAFIRYTDKKYDLIVYGLLDSHTLLAGTGGVRLDSYVYTVEAFREARARLKEGGMICLNFCVMSPGMGRKLFLMLQEAFDGKEPLVYDNGYDYSCTFITAENITTPSFPPDTNFTNITDILKNPSIPAHISTDDWPFFYMPERKYPVSYLVMIIVLLIASVIFIRRLTGGSEKGFSIPCFFLGAGFMLIETKGITELALVFGSTWIVIGLVISAILIMAFLANLLVIKKGSPPAWITYILLVISLLAGLYLTSLDLSNFPSWVARSVMTFLLTLPLFFSGFAFSGELKKSPSVAVALYSNLLGSMLGGFLEYNSMYFGFDSLYFFAIAMYIFAFLGSIRNR